MDRLYFENFPPGEIVEYGDTPVTAEAIVAFARQFDPQPFHLGEEAARGTLAGGLIASGWHTAAMLMRMNCDEFLNRAAAQGAPEVEELNWVKPVKPGDRLQRAPHHRERPRLALAARNRRRRVPLRSPQPERRNRHDAKERGALSRRPAGGAAP